MSATTLTKIISVIRGLRYGILLEYNKHQRLESVARRRLGCDPHDFVSLFYLSQSLVNRGRADEACEVFVQMLELEDVAAKTQVSMIYGTVGRLLKDGSYDRAVNCASRLLEFCKQAMPRLYLLRASAEGLFKLTRYDETARILAEINREYGDDTETAKFVEEYRKALRSRGNDS